MLGQIRSPLEKFKSESNPHIEINSKWIRGPNVNVKPKKYCMWITWKPKSEENHSKSRNRIGERLIKFTIKQTNKTKHPSKPNQKANDRPGESICKRALKNGEAQELDRNIDKSHDQREMWEKREKETWVALYTYEMMFMFPYKRKAN